MTRDAAYRRLAEVARAHLTPAPSGADGETIGPYRLLDRIGRGSAGEVYRAVDSSGHHVALKLLHRRWKGARYARELELLERASAEDGVVALLDAGRSPRGPYLVLELAEGGSLRQSMRARGPRSWVEAFRLIAQVAATLRALHAEGIVHRDLKPENILLRADERPLLSDFGLAKDLSDADGELTQAGFALGTIGYMAPELLAGKRDRLGPWTDIYSLGAVLYELVAGALPFAGRTLTEALAAAQGPIRPLAGVPADAMAVVRRCLARDGRERYPEGGALAEALGRAGA
jgi:serine/threonine-protein kinase